MANSPVISLVSINYSSAQLCQWTQILTEDRHKQLCWLASATILNSILFLITVKVTSTTVNSKFQEVLMNYNEPLSVQCEYRIAALTCCTLTYGIDNASDHKPPNLQMSLACKHYIDYERLACCGQKIAHCCEEISNRLHFISFPVDCIHVINSRIPTCLNV